MRNYFINYHYLWMNWLKIRDKIELIKNEKSESISVSTIRALKHDKKNASRGSAGMKNFRIPKD